MKLRVSACMVLVLVTLTACQLTGPVLNGKGSPSGSSNKFQYVFSTPTNPINLTIGLDTAKSSTSVIPLKGGQLKASASDGTLYTLDIPANALASSTKISITPASSVSGLPFGGKQTFAVQLMPEGLYLYKDAILTITPPQPPALNKLIFFGFKAGGQSLSLAIPVVDSKEIKIRLMHFSGYGVTDGDWADVAPVEQQLGSDPVSRIQDLTAETIEQMRQDQLDGKTTNDPQNGQAIVDLIDQYEKDVVKPSLEAAGSSCAAGKKAIQDVLSLERTRQLLGVGSSFNGADLLNLMSQAGQNCVKEEYQRCVDEHVINRMIPLYIGLMREHELLDSASPEPPEVKLARDLTAKCLTFELQFHSQGVFDTGDGGYNSTVDGKIMLHFDPTSFTIQGSGPLDNLSFEFKPPKGGKGMKCTASSKTGGSTFEVKSLEYVEDTRSETDPESYVRDFKLLYFPGVTSESYHINCIQTDSQGHQTQSDYDAPPSGYWTGMFFVIHQEELNAGSAGSLAAGAPPMPDMAGMLMGAIPAMPAPQMPEDGGFFLDQWDITPGDALMASKEWTRDNPSINITESGTLKLFHKPGG